MRITKIPFTLVILILTISAMGGTNMESEIRETVEGFYKGYVHFIGEEYDRGPSKKMWKTGYSLVEEERWIMGNWSDPHQPCGNM